MHLYGLPLLAEVNFSYLIQDFSCVSKYAKTSRYHGLLYPVRGSLVHPHFLWYSSNSVSENSRKHSIKNKFKKTNKNSPWRMFLKYKIFQSIYEQTERDWRNIVLFIYLFITIPLILVLSYLSPSLCTY